MVTIVRFLPYSFDKVQVLIKFGQLSFILPIKNSIL